jgi:mono/diheme cytochrome c family protein
MRGKLKVRAGRFLSKSGFSVKFRQASADSEEAAVLRVRRSVPWIAGVLAVLVASSALPQGNIDAGKSPAQLFADTCSNCHRRPQELKRASAGFLRQHYTPGAQEAAAMATYLSSIPADPRAGKEKAKAPPQEKEKAKAQQQAQERPQEKEKAKAQQPTPKGKRPEAGRSESPDAPAETRVEAASVPKLEPFEE